MIYSLSCFQINEGNPHQDQSHCHLLLILSSAPPSYLILSYLTSFLSSLLRLQKNLWVISTSRKSAPIEPTLVFNLNHNVNHVDDYLQHDVNDEGGQ